MRTERKYQAAAFHQLFEQRIGDALGQRDDTSAPDADVAADRAEARGDLPAAHCQIVFRHSSAHVLATAVTELFPETKLGHGPPTESGFFYDFYRPTPFTPEDLQRIEQRMQDVVERDEKFVREYMPRDKAIRQYEAENDWMKVHFIQKHTEGENQVSFYRNGKFIDFCRGPHIPSTGRIKAFKLLNLAGAYWLNDEKNPQLQRIYGTSFYAKKDLERYLNAIEEAKKRDHRVLGQQLDLFPSKNWQDRA